MQQKFSILLLLSVIIGAFACKKVDVQFGSDFIDNSNTQIIKIDTFSADLSTAYVDSFGTSNQGTTLIGGFSDPIFGRINTQTYFQVAPPSFEDIYDNVLFDSLTLILKLNKSYYGDTTKPVRINVSRLADKIQPFDNGITLYNVDSFNVDPVILGSKDVIVSPTRGDTISIKLNATLGQELLNKFIAKSDTIKISDVFLKYFKGLRISSDGNSNLIFGCKDSATLRIQYKKKDLYLINKNIDFTLFNNSLHFTNIKVDRSKGRPDIANLPTLKEIDSRLTGNAAYGNSAAGTIIKIRFTSLRELLKAPNFAKILSARLIIRPVAGTYDRNYFLPPQLRLSTTTALNQIGVDLTTLAANGTPITQLGNLFVDYGFGVNTAYSYDVTNYIKFAITDAVNNKNGLLLTPPFGAYQTSFSRVAVGSRLNNIPNSKIELQIYYAAVQ